MLKLNEEQWRIIMSRLQTLEMELQNVQQGLGLQDVTNSFKETGSSESRTTLLQSIANVNKASLDQTLAQLINLQSGMSQFSTQLAQVASNMPPRGNNEIVQDALVKSVEQITERQASALKAQIADITGKLAGVEAALSSRQDIDLGQKIETSNEKINTSLVATMQQIHALPAQISNLTEGVKQHQSNEANALLNLILGQLQAGSNAAANQIGALPLQISGLVDGIKQHQSYEVNGLLNAILGQLQAGSNAVAGQIGGLPPQFEAMAASIRLHQSNEANTLLNLILGQIQGTANAQAQTAAGIFEQIQAILIDQKAVLATTLKATAVTDRARWKATASLVAPELTPVELELLNDYELSTDSTLKVAHEVAWPTQLSPHMSSRRLSPADRADPGTIFLKGSPSKIINAIPQIEDETPIEANLGVPIPDIKIIGGNRLFPTINVTNDKKSKLDVVDYIIQIDTNKSFSTRNTITYPRLAPSFQGADLSDRLSVPLHAGYSSLRDYKKSHNVEFPFRVLALAIDLDKASVGLDDLVALSHVLQVGLSKRDAILSIFNFVRQAIFPGGNLIEVNPLDTLASGIGACGAMNDFAGVLLELFGIRYRCVGGFNPTTRVFYPGGGHTAIEAWDGDLWIYLDPYCDLIQLGGAAELVNSISGKALVHQPPSVPTMALSPQLKTLFDNFSFADLFKYRVYGDKMMRSPMVWMLALKGSKARQDEPTAYTEDNYGLDWPLRPPMAVDYKPDLPEDLTIYVRARCLVAKNPIINMGADPSAQNPDESLGPWGYAEFLIRPRELYQACLEADQTIVGNGE